jgi:hypothetical protein
MRQVLIVLLGISLLAGSLFSQEADALPPEQFGLKHLSEYLGLQPEDISFRPDYTEPDSFRLQLVADLMTNPLGMIPYAASLKDAHVESQPEILASIMFQDLAFERRPERGQRYQAEASEIERVHNLYFNDMALNQILTRAALYLDVIFPRSAERMLAELSEEQQLFLRRQFKELILIDEEEEFWPLEVIDSVENIEEGYCEQFVEFGYRVNADPLVAAGIDCLRDMMQEVGRLRSQLSRGEVSAEKIMNGTIYLPENSDRSSYLGCQPGWMIGGPGNDYYRGEYQFILDLGGDDVYDLSTDPDNPQGTIIIDLGGNDRYRAGSDFSLGSGYFSVGLLIDFAGDDRYDGKSFSIGSGYFGVGVLWDGGGDDRYSGDTHAQGAGTFGLGLLIDEGGRDIYDAALHAQGFGFVGGAGILFEGDGSDAYHVGGKYKDVLRYKDHYLTLGQGFGYGLRPFTSGGIGAIIDVEGNDSYYSDIFGQGSAYWWSLGIIYDSAGNDSYQSFQYAQGAATHMALGILVDDEGSDVYFSKGVSQGCGHDYSCGILLDRAGHDTYTAYDLSQAAGSANGAGVLIDNDGDDRYFVKNPANTQGYGNPRRDFGSIGWFIDLGGADQYSGNGRDNYYWRTDSKWGGGMDIQYILPDSAEDSQ